jgi:hypothetical protein
MKLSLSFQPKLFLVIDSQAQSDGAGAQLQRIVSVFCIASLVKVGYLHSEIIDIDAQVFSRKNQKERKLEVEKWNGLFRKDLTNFSVSSSDRIISPRRTSISVVKFVRFISRFSTNRIIWKMADPRIITDRFPNCLAAAPELLDLQVLTDPSIESKTQRTIVIHIRQGELALSQFKDRLLPLAHYEKILRQLIPILNDSNVEFRILIPTENDHENRISLNDPKVIESLRLNPNNENLVFIEGGYVRLVHEKPTFAHTPLLQNAYWLPEDSVYEDFLKMVRADILVTSKSSLSFTAGLFNRKSIKIYTPFWHSAPSDWISVNDLTSSECQIELSKKLAEFRN